MWPKQICCWRKIYGVVVVGEKWLMSLLLSQCFKVLGQEFTSGWPEVYVKSKRLDQKLDNSFTFILFLFSTESVKLIDEKLKEAHAAKLDLEQNRTNLERDIRLKEMSMEIDQSKCLTLRQHFPFTIKCSVATKFNSVDRRRFRVNVKT